MATMQATMRGGNTSRHVSCVHASEHFLTLTMMTSITPTDTSMTATLSVPPTNQCPDLELVVPAPEQSLHTERPSDIPPETMNAPCPSVPGNLPAFPDDVDPHPLGLVGLAEDMDVRELEPSSVDAHEQGGALLVVDAAPAVAKETTSVEPAGEAERAAATRPEALASWTQGEAGHEAETPP